MTATRHLIIAIALTAAAAGSALAQEVTVFPPAATGTASRAAVVAEAADAVRQGKLHESHAIHLAQPRAGTLSRDMVRSDARLALASGEIARLNAQSHDFAPVAAPALQLSASGR